jgi:hypothetical protein
MSSSTTIAETVLKSLEHRIQTALVPAVKRAILGYDEELGELLRQLPGSPVSIFWHSDFF